VSGVIVPEPAIDEEAGSLVELREQAARWLLGRGIAQWEPGEVSASEVRAQIRDGQWFVVRQPVVVAGLRLLWSDEAMWGVRPDDAGYVHGLVVDRQCAGRGLGAALLEWAEQQARAAGRPYLRLDCVANNAALRNYYAKQEFREVDCRDFDGPWHSVVLLEKQV
jgi:ribosomal protein S18 acetylase RimI-like enzyme